MGKINLPRAFKKAAEYLDNPRHFRQDGKYGHVYNGDTKFCLIGAVANYAKISPERVHNSVVDSLYIVWGDAKFSITEFNDSKETSNKDVVLLALLFAEILKGDEFYAQY